MLFHEIFGSYYRTVAVILREATAGTLTKKRLQEVVQQCAFGESMLTIPDAFASERWPLLTKTFDTPLQTPPRMPLTNLEKRWMKAILSDPRVQLFGLDDSGLENVEPLFRQEWLCYYDRYTDGDPFEDAGYIRNFRQIRQAMQEKKQLEIKFCDAKGNLHHTRVSPQYLEYSQKDDRFRLAAEGFRPWIINLSRVQECRILEEAAYTTGQVFRNDQSVTLELTDERNALERALLHFSHLEKEAKKLDDTHYRIILHYDRKDETELLIRILSFGPQLEVISPAQFREKIRDRLNKQNLL